MLRLLELATVAAGLTLLLAPQALAEDRPLPPVQVYKAPGWGCCGGWSKHLEDVGFIVHEEESPRLAEIKAHYKIPLQAQSCHTAIVDGYVIEGHVPQDEIVRILRERPDIIGLSVPGMPIGSPGMEMPGRNAEPYRVLALNRDGTITVYTSYPK